MAPRGRTADRAAQRPVSPTVNRSVALSQLSFGSAVLLFVLTMQLFEPARSTAVPPLLGILITFVATGVAIAVPWYRLPRAVITLLPLADVVAVDLIRADQLNPGVTLLMVFPTLWLASYFGLAGLLLAVIPSTVSSWVQFLVSGRAFTEDALLVLVLWPAILGSLALSAMLTGRRTRAQRRLLQLQAERLERAVTRTRRQEELIAEVLNSVDFGVMRLDRSGRGTIMNETYARIYGLERARPQDAAHTVAYGPDRSTPLAEHRLPYNRAVDGEDFEGELTWVPDRSGELRALLVTARQLIADDDSADGAVLVVRDATTEIRAVRARDDLVASVSHELRTPLTSLLGYIELSEDAPDVPETVRHNLAVMNRNGQRMLELIAGILAASREAARPAPLDRCALDLADVVGDSIELLGPAAHEQGITIDTSALEHATVVGDVLRLRQVIDNLLGNAIKYNQPRGTVHLGTTMTQDTAWIIVRDTGIGIAAGELPHVFEQFFRSETVRNSTTHGSGLGLGISRDIVRHHGGQLTVDSVHGAGTTVVVTLPREASA